MSGCSKYKDFSTNVKANSYEELDLVTKFIVRELLKEYDYLYVFGSRFKGGWRYCSDFDIAVPYSDNLALKAKEYSLKFGVMVELRNSSFFETNEGQGLKIEKWHINN